MDWGYIGAVIGIVGAVIGATLGLAGAAFGVWCGLKSAKGPRERKMMVTFTVILTAGVLLYCALLFLLPTPYRYFIWIPYILILFLAVFKIEHIRRRIRKEETQT